MIRYINHNDNMNFTLLDEIALEMKEAGWVVPERNREFEKYKLTARITKNSHMTLALHSSQNPRYIVNPEGHPIFYIWDEEDVKRWNDLGGGKEFYYPLFYYQTHHLTQFGNVSLVDDERMENEWKHLQYEDKGKLGVIPETDTMIVVHKYDARLPVFYVYNILRLSDDQFDFYNYKKRVY